MNDRPNARSSSLILPGSAANVGTGAPNGYHDSEAL
jgi:hypothetical protein